VILHKGSMSLLEILRDEEKVIPRAVRLQSAAGADRSQNERGGTTLLYFLRK